MPRAEPAIENTGVSMHIITPHGETRSQKRTVGGQRTAGDRIEMAWRTGTTMTVRNILAGPGDIRLHHLTLTKIERVEDTEADGTDQAHQTKRDTSAPKGHRRKRWLAGHGETIRLPKGLAAQESVESDEPDGQNHVWTKLQEEGQATNISAIVVRPSGGYRCWRATL